MEVPDLEQLDDQFERMIRIVSMCIRPANDHSDHQVPPPAESIDHF